MSIPRHRTVMVYKHKTFCGGRKSHGTLLNLSIPPAPAEVGDKADRISPCTPVLVSPAVSYDMNITPTQTLCWWVTQCHFLTDN